jgi:uncharacterized membrane-anchored protein
MFRRRRQPTQVGDGVIHGIARVDARTKRLLGRIQAGEIAVIDHNDLDRIAAEGLVERRVKAVLNAAPSSTGRFPNLGPLVLTTANIPLIDSVGPELFEKVKDGDYIQIEDGRILSGEEVVAKGDVETQSGAQDKLDEAKKDIATALEEFAENTLGYLVSEREFLLEATRLPNTRTDFAHRHVLVVVRGYGFKEDLDSLRRGYVRDFKPILVGVDGAADALLEVGLTPDVIIGDMDSVSTEALTSGAELVLHAYADGRAPGKARLDTLSLPYVTFEAPGTSEDVALLLAHEKGAELIVAVGTRASLIELMDKGRKGMASTFLVRLRVGPKLVDAKGVSELHRTGPSGLQILALLVAALITMVIVADVTPMGRVWLDSARDWLELVWFNLRQIFR